MNELLAGVPCTQPPTTITRTTLDNAAAFMNQALMLSFVPSFTPEKTTIYGIQQKGLAINWFTNGSCQMHSCHKVLDLPWLMQSFTKHFYM